METFRRNQLESKMKEIDFKSIKNYSKLPQLLSEQTEKGKKFKTQKEILREFNDEKWAMVLDILAKEPSVSLHDVDKIMCNFNETLPFYHFEKFYLGTGKNSFDTQLEVYAKTLRPYLKGASCLVEMGAGYGSKILNLSKNKLVNCEGLCHMASLEEINLDLIRIFSCHKFLRRRL